MKKKRPSALIATPELAEFIKGLESGSYTDKIITKAKEELRENMFAGDPVKKKLIPDCYVKEYGLNNLYVFDLDDSCRLTYTLVHNGSGVCVACLEVFLSHKDYEKRFGYS